MTGLGFPDRREYRVDIVVELAGGVVGDVEQRVLRLRDGGCTSRERGYGGESEQSVAGQE
jgi:hypothetical protein